MMEEFRMRKYVLAAALAALSLPGSAIAHEAGEVFLRLGVSYADPYSSSSRVNGRRGTGIEVDSSTAAGLTATYMVLPRFGLEASISSPFSHKLSYEVGRSHSYDLGKFSRLSPAFTAQYFFLNPKSRFQPYIGLGLNYTMYYNEEVSREAKKNYGASDLKMRNSVGFVSQIGMDFRITDRVFVNTSIWWMGATSKVEWREAGGSYRLKSDVDVDPWVYSLGVGFRF
jgi:outer membrane protein